jgi:hypothetical protein
MEGLPPIDITCFYEELPLLGVGLVREAEPVSSQCSNISRIGHPTRFSDPPGLHPHGIHCNHMEMTKFAERTDPGFIAVCGEFSRWIKTIEAGKKQHVHISLTDLALVTQSNSTNQYGNRQNNNVGGMQQIVQSSDLETQGDQHIGTILPNRVGGEKKRRIDALT